MTNTNTALVPVPKLEEDFYDWYQRHEEILRIQAELDPQVVLIGDSITHFWGGTPLSLLGDKPAAVSAEVWHEVFGDLRVLNMGFGWDRTQNVLWRLANGQLSGLRPRLVCILIGTNNLSQTTNARSSTPEEIAAGIVAVHAQVRRLCPESQIVVMSIFPRGFQPDSPTRAPIARANALVAQALTGAAGTTLLDVGHQFVSPDGTLPAELFPDGTHLSEAAYRIWGRALREKAIEPLFGSAAC